MVRLAVTNHYQRRLVDADEGLREDVYVVGTEETDPELWSPKLDREASIDKYEHIGLACFLAAEYYSRLLGGKKKNVPARVPRKMRKRT